MSNKREKYYDLDDIGEIGVVNERSPEEARRDAEEMSAVIRAYKLGKASVKVSTTATPKKYSRTTSKVKVSSRRSKAL
jgi:hypothetical protein